MMLPLERTRAPGQAALLRQLKQAGLPVAPTWLLDLEEEFYVLGNLPEQIGRAFLGVFGARLDEDRLETACRTAQQLVRQSYLLPERAEEVIRLIGRGPWLVRYAELAPLENTLHTTPQDTLWALKRLWASRWNLEEVLERSPQLAPPTQPTLIQQVSQWPSLQRDLSSQASKALAQTVRVWASEQQVVWVATG
jgi:hypothetical protein